MLHSLKTKVSLIFLCFFSLVSPIKGSSDCANITNITWISASSVLVEWDYHVMQELFEIKIFENGTQFQTIPHIRSGRSYAYLISNLSVSSMQHLCFTVQFESTVMSSISSGDVNESDAYVCPRQCLPLSPQVPEAPKGLSYDKMTSMFSWNATKGPVLLACIRTSNDTVVRTIIREFCGCCAPVYIDGLEHSSPYTCSLSEKNGVIVGHSNTISITTDVKRLVPPRYSITSVNTTSITVEVSNSSLQYQICIKLLPSDGQCVFNNSYQPGNFKTMIEVCNISLYPFTTYQVQVEARINDVSTHWSYPNSKNFTTLEEAPGKILLVLAHLDINTSMIVISWRPPEINNGSIIAYMYCWSNWNSELMCKNTTGNSTIIELMSGVVYSVTVAAFTNGGRGPFSDHVYVNIPKAAIPTTSITHTEYLRTEFIQLKFRGINYANWLNYSQTLMDDIRNDIRNDIVNDISAQTSNKCNCNFSLPSSNTEVSIQSFNISKYDDLGTFLLHISLQRCINTHCALRQALEDWYGGPTPHVTVLMGTLTLFLLREPKCPLYTNSLSSSECLLLESQLLPVTGHSLERGSGDIGVTVTGALIGGIALGVALTVGIGLVIFFLLWYRKHHHDGKNVKMMKKIEIDSEAPLSTRYIPANKNINEDYEPVSVCTHDTEDPGLDNAYEPMGGGQPPGAATVKSTKVGRSNQKKTKKNVNSASASNEISGQKVVHEDAAGYVVPDVLWEGKQRPVASTENTKSAQAQTPDKRGTFKVSANTAAAIKTVEYDIPEGVDTSQSRTHAQPASKVKGQREQSSKENPQQPTFEPISSETSHSTQQPSSGKGHHKQLQKLLQPAAPDNGQQEQASQIQLQPSSINLLQGKVITKPVQEESKQNKKSKLNLQQKTHDTVKSKLQNLLSPMPAHGTAHTSLPRQTSSSTVEKTKVTKLDSDSPVSKVKAMASMLEGGGSTPSTASGSDVSNSKSAGGKKKSFLPKTAVSSSAEPQGQQPQQLHGASDINTPPQQGVPVKKPKPADKFTANIAMKTNKAYGNWAKDREGSETVQPAQNQVLRRGGRGYENVYHF